MFKTRLISGVVLIAVALLTLIVGGPLLFIVMLALSLIGLYEFYTAMKVRGDRMFGILDLGGYAAVVVWYISTYFFPQHRLMILLMCFLGLMFIYVFTFPKYNAGQAVASFFGVVYLGVMLSCVFSTRMLPGGIAHVWLIVISAWGADTTAYCVGRKFGKHKMAPVLSPKKSIEGAIGGLVGAAVIGLIFGFCTRGPFLVYAIICLIAAFISMVGDLTASAVKRNVGIKDYGKLIPGHGGILDRFDSVIFVAPVIYFLMTLSLGVL